MPTDSTPDASDEENTHILFDENTTPRSLHRAARRLQARLSAEQTVSRNLQRKFDDISNTVPDGDDDDGDSTSPAKKRRHRQEDGLDSDQPSVEEAEAEEVKGLGRRFLILHGPWLRRKELIFQIELDENYVEEERFKDINTLIQGQLHEIRGLLPEKYLGDAFTKKWLSKSFAEGMDSQRSNTATRLRKLASAIFGVDTLNMSPSTTRQEKFRNMIGWTTNEHGRGSYSSLKVEILHKDYNALIRGPSAAIEMIKGNFGIRPMTETMESIHGIRNITPGAIATTAILAIWCLSGDDTLQQRGATTGIDYLALYEGYLKLIMSGVRLGKADFINIIQQWDEAIFPGTETSIVARKNSSGGAENEIDREIEMMEMESDNE